MVLMSVLLTTAEVTAALPLERAMLGTMEIVAILVVVVILFGATKLPQLGKGLGEAIGNFKKAQRDAEKEIARDQEIDGTPRIDTQGGHKPLDADKPRT